MISNDRTKRSSSIHSGYNCTPSIDFDEFEKVKESYTKCIILRKSEPFNFSRPGSRRGDESMSDNDSLL